MKLIFSIVLMMNAVIALAQTDASGKLKLESININAGTEGLFHGRQNFNSFSNTVSDDFVFQVDSGARELHPVSTYRYHTFSAEAGFHIEGSKWRLITGASYNQRLERHYTFELRNETIIDTVYAPIPYIYPLESEYQGVVYYDTLLLDSTSMNELTVKSSTKNVFIHAEIIRDFKKNKYTFSTGIGLALGVSVKNEVTSRYTNYWGLTMVNDWDPDYYHALWYADIPKSNYGAATINPVAPTPVNSDFHRLKGNTIFTVKPYIPIRVEAIIAEKGFFSKVGVIASARAGLEFQMIKGDGIRARPFWNYQAGLFFRFSNF